MRRLENQMAVPYQIMNSDTTKPMGVGQNLQNLPVEELWFWE
jgi:hypothetical protein